MPTKPPDERQPKILDALVPVRPPLRDLPRRVQNVQEALNSGATGFSWVSASSENAQAATLYNEFQTKDLLIAAPDLQEYANQLMARLAAVIPGATFEWRLIFIRGVLPNAMNVGGGYLFPTQGLLEVFDTEAELAFVVAHEMAHQLKGYVAVAQTRHQMTEILLIAAEAATPATTGISGAMSQVGSLAAQITLAHFDRAQELEADRLAMDIIAAAGYDPRLALSTMERLEAIEDKYGTQPTIVPRPEPSRSGSAPGGDPELARGARITKLRECSRHDAGVYRDPAALSLESVVIADQARLNLRRRTLLP